MRTVKSYWRQVLRSAQAQDPVELKFTVAHRCEVDQREPTARERASEEAELWRDQALELVNRWNRGSAGQYQYWLNP